MKKFFLSVVLLATTFTTISAQELSYGLKGGLNVIGLNGDDGDMASPKVGFNAGVFMEYSVSDKISIQPELMFSTQGANLTKGSSYFTGSGASSDGSLSIVADTKLKLSYINIPVLAKIYVTEGFTFNLGPQLGLLMSAKQELENEHLSDLFGEQDVKDNLETIDFGFVVGFGYQFGDHFLADVRYNLGLFNIVKEEGHFQNSTAQLSLGYKF